MLYPGTDAKKLLHRVLMAPAALERLPAGAILLSLAALAAAVGWTWASWWMAAGWFAFVLFDWWLLANLPRTRRSFGPVYPPLLALALLRLLAALLCAWSGLNWLLWLTLAALTLLAWYGTWVEPLALEVTQQLWQVPQWPAGSSLRLLHLSDLHLERIGRREQELDRLIAELEPDLICFTGDLLNLSYNSDPAAIAEARRLLAGWHAPLGVYAVSGSPLVDLSETTSAILEGLPNLHWLRDKSVRLQADGKQLTLIGLTCTHNPTQDGPQLVEILREVPAGDPVILLYHTPDLAPDAAQACGRGVDLQLSGHTHGGQIRLPLLGALVTSSIYYKRFEMGRYHLARDGRQPTTLYVSRGIGLEGGAAPRARFLCRPEIILWTLTGGHPTH